MSEGKCDGMKIQTRRASIAVDRIPHDRVSALSQMGAQLMGTTGERDQPQTG